MKMTSSYLRQQKADDYVTVLAICDDEAVACASTASSASPNPNLDRNQTEESVVEIKSFESQPTLAVRNPLSSMPNPLHKEIFTGALRSSLKTEKKDGSDYPRIMNRVTLSPDVERKLISSEGRGGLARGSARKSRISDKFYEAQDRLQDRLKSSDSPTGPFPRSASDLGSGGFMRKTPLLQALENPKYTVIVFPDDEAMSMGIEVTGVVNEEGKLSSLQIMKIEPDGRVGMDGRLCVGDNIVAIDGRSVGELSQLRARALISDMSTKGAPTLTVSRPISSFKETSVEPSPSTSSLAPKRPILSALQQANTQQIGQTCVVYVQKRSNGFGFTVTGRETARGERLFYIGTVRADGAAFGQLKAGDRLIKINGIPTAELQQSDVVERLKKTSTGASVTLEISRVEQNDENVPPENGDLQENKTKKGESDVESDEKGEASKSPAVIHRARLVNTANNVQELVLDVPLNDTGSAGLGVSLKARVSVKSDGTRRDCGIFVKKLLVGGAAWKDGRLMVDDQLISIEDIDLRKFTRNAEASEAVTKKLKQIGHNASHVRLRVLRQIGATSPAVSSDGSTRITVDGPDATLVVGPSSNESAFESTLLASTPIETNLHIRRNSSASTSTKRSEVDDELQSNAEPFDREAPTRKSMSEKRGMGATLDPSTSTTYQKIRHQRQTSAPTSNLATRSFHGFVGRSASARAQARARSLSMHPPGKGEGRRDGKTSSDQQESIPPEPHIDYHQEPNGSPTRGRSRSVDVNLIRAGEEAIFQENPSSQLIPSSLSSGFKNPSFKHAVAGESGNSQDISVLIANRNNPNYTAEKQQRRKSMGSAMKNWFRIGNRSREGSPEKRDPSTSKDNKDNRRDTNGQYATGLVSSPRLNRRDLRREKVKSEYDPTFAECTALTSPSREGFQVANSRFYRSLAPRGTEARAMAMGRSIQPLLTISALSTDTNSTDGLNKRQPPRRAPPPPPHSKQIDETPVDNTNRSEVSAPAVAMETAHHHRPTMSSQTHSPITGTNEKNRVGAEKAEKGMGESNEFACVQSPLRLTTMLSMRGSHTREVVESEHDRVSRPHSLEASASPLLFNPNPQRVLRPPHPQKSAHHHNSSTADTDRVSGQDHFFRQLPSQSTSMHHTSNSTDSSVHRIFPLESIPHTSRQQTEPSPRHTPLIQPIFPTSRVFHATSLTPGGKFGERLSMRAKKKYRREIRSEYVDDSNRGIPANWHPLPVPREIPIRTGEDASNHNQSTTRRSLTHRSPSYRYATSMYEDEEPNRSFILQTGTPVYSKPSNAKHSESSSASKISTHAPKSNASPLKPFKFLGPITDC